MSNVKRNKYFVLIHFTFFDDLITYRYDKESTDLDSLISSNKVSSIIYEGDRHEILNEDDKDKVITDIVEWMKKVL